MTLTTWLWIVEQEKVVTGQRINEGVWSNRLLSTALIYLITHIILYYGKVPMCWYMPGRHVGGVVRQFDLFLALALDRDEWLASHDGCLSPWGRCTHYWTKGWVSSTASLRLWGREKSPKHVRNWPTIPITHLSHALSEVSPGYSCVKTTFFRQEGGIEAAQATRQKWIENEHRKITDSVIGNLLYLIICKKNHPSQPVQSSRLVTLLKFINVFTQVQLLLFCTTVYVSRSLS